MNIKSETMIFHKMYKSLNIVHYLNNIKFKINFIMTDDRQLDFRR